MPRATSAPSKATQGSKLYPERGTVEVVDAKYINKSTNFKPNQLYLTLTCAYIGDDGKQIEDADDFKLDFGFGKTSLDHFTPGKAKSMTDENVRDMGKEEDAEGNTIYCNDSNSQFNKNSQAMVFLESLVAAGFDEELLNYSWAPMFIGMKFQFVTLPADQINKKFGTKLSEEPIGDSKGAPTYKVIAEWLNPNYLDKNGNPVKSGKATNDKSAGNKSDKSASNKTASGKSANGKPAAGKVAKPVADDDDESEDDDLEENEEVEDDDVSDDESEDTDDSDDSDDEQSPDDIDTPEDAARYVLALVAKSAKGRTFKSLGALKGAFTNQFVSSGIDNKLLSKSQKLVLDADWVEGQVEEIGGKFTATDDGATVKF